MFERPYLSIGEVLGLLLEEFDDVTISKIRFLESQGLIEPERTPSGYRKFYEPDVERLKVILREQRENFLPLRVIRDRLENGTIEGDPTGGNTPPRGIRNVVVDPPPDDDITLQLSLATGVQPSSANHPSAAPRASAEPPRVSAEPAPAAAPPVEPPPVAPKTVAAKRPVAVRPLGEYRDSFGATDVCKQAGITTDQLAELESFGLIAGHSSGGLVSYTEHDVAVAVAAASFLHRGVEGRHLRAWRQAADREAALFEQLVLPLVRQRNPQSRQRAVETLNELSRQGGELRSALLNAALRQHLDG